jgi:predicted dehydrogenase
MEAVGVVVVGTGFGCITHVRALRAAGFEVRALVGRDADRTTARARLFDVPLASTDVDEALALPGVDAVTIATPPHTHAEIASAAIEAGMHVLCEKPFARDAAEARDLLAIAERAGIVHLLGTEFRWDPGQATLARTIAAGEIGAPRLATVILHVPVLADRGAEIPAWWTDESAGGGWLGAHGSQVIDQIRVSLGEFAGVSASLPNIAGRGAEDAFVVHFRLASGVTGIMQSTCGDWGPFLVETRVVGTEGTAWIDGLSDRVLVARKDGTRQVPVDAHPAAGTAVPLPDGAVRTDYDRMIAHGLDLPPYTRLAEAFRDLIAGLPITTSPQPATFVDGVAGMEVLDAIRASAAGGNGGAWIPIP